MAPKKTKKPTGKTHPAAAVTPPGQSELDAAVPAQPDSTRAHWTTTDETELVEFILDHQAEGGDGLNFKAATWTAAAKLLETQRTKGGTKTSLACKNKFANLKEIYLIVDALKQVSGFTWDDKYGADINDDNLSVWESYIERYPKAAKFKKKGWPHYDAMKAMMPTRTKSANIFQPILSAPEQPVSSSSNSGGQPEDGGGGEGSGDHEDETEIGGDENEKLESVRLELAKVIDPSLSTQSQPRHPVPPLSAVMTHKRRFSALDDPASGTTSSASTPGPAAKRRHMSATAVAPDPHITSLNARLEDFTEAFREATGTTTTAQAVEAASPTRRRLAIRSAQVLEVDLTDEQLVALVDLFTKDVSAADAYMELKRDGLRKAWVAKRLKHAEYP